MYLVKAKYKAAIPNHFPNAILDKSVIMPNHIHPFTEINDKSKGVET
ncbi:MAG: hypothetical protein ABFD00_00985 [Chloroherpetonaceae bacterium]